MRLDVVMWADSPWQSARGEWRHAEELGLNAGWLYDHLFWKQDRPWHEAYTTLAAVAASTTRIGMGTMVTSPNFRHPVTSAKAAFTLHDISAGRFTLGIGAGGPGCDADVFAAPTPTRAERTARFAEWVELTYLLLSKDTTSHIGRHFSAQDVAIGADGTSATRPPIAVAGTGKNGMALAARFADQWITQDISQDPKVYAGSPHAEIQRQTALLDEVCRSQDRDPASLPRLCVLGYGDERPLASIEAFRDCVGRYGQLGVSTIAVLWPRGADAHHQLRVLGQAAAESTSGGI